MAINNKEHKTWWLAVALSCVIALYIVGAQWVVPAVTDYFFEGQLDSGFMVFMNYGLIALSALVLAVVVALVLGLKVVTPRPEFRRLNPRLIVWGVIVVVASNVILTPAFEVLPRMDVGIVPDFMQGGFWPMLTCVVVWPMLMQWIFRGVIQHSIADSFGAIWGVIISALLFGFIYVYPAQIMSAMALGLVLAVVYQLTGSLWTVVAIHMLNNGLSYLLYLMFGNNDAISQQYLSDDIPWLITYVAALTIIIISVARTLPTLLNRPTKWGKIKPKGLPKI